MAKFVYGMNMSLDGYIDHELFAPDDTLYQHWIDHAGEVAGSIYGRKLYELMTYWDEDQPDWRDSDRAFAAAWRKSPKWVVSTTLTDVGPNATLISDNIESTIRQLKADNEGEFEVGGTDLAQHLTNWGLIDEYRLYMHPVVLGKGTPLFSGPRPRLRLTGSQQIGDDVMRLTYVPAE